MKVQIQDLPSTLRSRAKIQVDIAQCYFVIATRFSLIQSKQSTLSSDLVRVCQRFGFRCSASVSLEWDSATGPWPAPRTRMFPILRLPELVDQNSLALIHWVVSHINQYSNELVTNRILVEDRSKTPQLSAALFETG